MNAFSLFGRIALDDREYQSGLKKAESETTKSATKIERDWKKVGDQIGKTGKALSVGLTGAITAVAGAAVASAVAVGNYADRILDLAEQTGLSTDRLQAFERVAIEAGVSSDVLGRSAQALTMRLSATGDESARFTDTMEMLGIETRNADGSLRSMDDLLPDIMRGLAGVEDITTRNALATEVFGRSSADILPVLALGADRIDELTQEAIDLGQVLGLDALNAANDFRVQQELLTDALQRTWREVSIALLPVMTQLVEFVQQNILPAVRNFTAGIVNLIERFQALTARQQGLIAGLVTFAAALGPALLLIGKMLTIVPAVTAAFASLRLAMLALVAGPLAPFVLIGAAIVALFLLWQRNVGGMQDRFRAFTVDVRESFERTFQAVRGAFAALGDAWSRLTTQNSEAWATFVNFAQRVFGAWVQVALDNLSAILRGFARVIEVTANVITNWEELGIAARLIFEQIQSIVRLTADNMRLSFVMFALQTQLLFANLANTIRGIFFNMVDGVVDAINEVMNFIEPVADTFGITVRRLERVNRDAFRQIGADIEREMDGVVDSMNDNNRRISQSQQLIGVTVTRVMDLVTGSTSAAVDAADDLAESFEAVEGAAVSAAGALRNPFNAAAGETGEVVDEIVRSLRELVDEYHALSNASRIASTDQHNFNMAGLEGSSHIESFNDHLQVQQRDFESASNAGLAASGTLEDFAAGAERAALRAAEMAAGLDAGNAALRLTAAEGAEAAGSLTEFMRIQVALGAATEEDLLRVLHLQVDALQAARGEVTVGSDEWVRYSNELLSVMGQIDRLTPKLNDVEKTALDVANGALNAARAAKLLGDEAADVAGALSVQISEMELLLQTLDPTSEAYLRLAESIAAARGELLSLTNTEQAGVNFAETISTAVSGLAVTMIGLAAAGGDLAQNIALAFAEMAQAVLNEVLRMALAKLLLNKLETVLAASSPFSWWMVAGLAAGALAAGALISQLRGMGARAPGGDGGAGGAGGGVIGQLQDRRTMLTRALTEARSEQDIEAINRQLREVDEELGRLRDLGLDDDVARAPGSPGRGEAPVSFGGVPQSVQLAISTPLLEASNRMLDAATIMQNTFGGMLPGSMTPESNFASFTSVLDRMTPVLERLLVEGVQIRTIGAAQPQTAGLAFLR